jgi:hypothetical protein
MSEVDVSVASPQIGGIAGSLGGKPNQPHGEAAQDLGVNTQDNGFATDVDGVMADGEKEGHPVFDVSAEEFYNNMKQDRKRLRFASGTKAQQYHSSTKYNRPFFIRNKIDGYLRKVK